LHWDFVRHEIYCRECRESFEAELLPVLKPILEKGQRYISSRTVSSKLSFHRCGMCGEIVVGDKDISRYVYPNLTDNPPERQGRCLRCDNERNEDRYDTGHV
jgi:hypothetical protein